MVRDFEQWNASIGEHGLLTELSDTRLGIEAADYIKKRIFNHPREKEPLVPALGGLPIALEQQVEADLLAFKKLNVEPRFVFSGLDITDQEEPFRQKQEQVTVNANAWSLYDNHQAEASVAKFGESTYVTPEDLFPALQSILTKHELRFTVAPYSAWAQLAYMERIGHCNAVAGSSEILLFECKQVITSWDFATNEMTYTTRDKCISDLAKFANNVTITEDIFVDACILAGTPFLPTLPTLNSPNRTELKPHTAIKMIMSNGKNGHSAVVNSQDDPRLGQMNYVDRYRKARLAVKNHPVYLEEGKIEPQNTGMLPNDAVEYLKSRLPDEVLHYMSNGLISARLLQWRTSCNIFDVPPMDGGESEEYKNLVSSKLTPLRTTAINLLSSSLHNWYRHKNVEQRSWFSDPTAKAQEIRVVGTPETLTIVDSWNVKEAAFKDAVLRYQGCGYLGAAVLSLQNADFVPTTITQKSKTIRLSSINEILYNSIWRFLALREYVDAKHNLTPWGKVLVTAIAALKGKSELEEATVVAVELVRLNCLNADIGMFPTYNGAPMRGTKKDQQFNILVSRVAGLGTLQHRPIGYTGPLSQHLLGYNSIINLVRQTLRDMVEVASTHMFLSNCCDRLAVDLSEVAMKLPFRLANNCALSIAMKSYLDELLANNADLDSSDAKAAVLEIASSRYFPQSINLPADLEIAFELWEAICQGVINGGSAVPEANKKLWRDTDSWLQARR